MTPDIYELAIVFVGEINPVIMQPFWLVNKGLIQETEGETAEIEVIHDEIVKFKLDWVTFEVTRQKFYLTSTKQSYFPMVKDLAISIFKILRDTPIRNLGINHILHFRFDENKFLELGKQLAPFDNWDNVLENPRLLRLEMIDLKRNDGYLGHYRVRVASSELIKTFGVSININDHFNKSDSNSIGTLDMVTALNNNWNSSVERAKHTYTQLWKNLKI